jgi:hypothetical protein
MADNWFIVRDDKKHGPYSLVQMKEFAASGKLLPIDMVLQEGTNQWSPASQVDALFPARGTASPPPPPPTANETVEWHYFSGGQQCGPVSWTQLRELAVSGRLRPAEMVWKHGMPSWAAAGSIPNLFPSPAAVSPSPIPPPIPAPPPASQPDAPGRVGAIINLLQQANDLWRKLTLPQRIGVIAVAAVVLVLFLVSTITKASGGGDQGKSLWQVLMDLGVVSGAVGLVYGLVQKYLEKKLFSEAPAAFGQEGAIDQPAFRQAPKIKGDPVFMGLSAHQWLVTLHIVLLAGVVGTVLTGFLFGATSLWVNGTALLVVGGLIAFLSVRVAVAYEEQLRRDEKTPVPKTAAALPLWEPHIPLELKLSFVLGLSVLAPALIAVVMSTTTSPPMGKHATWAYFVYGVAFFLPELHALAGVARRMQPIRNSAGLWISGAYLVAMFASCVLITMTIAKPERAVDVPDSVRSQIVGNWKEVEGGFMRGGATIEFKKDGRAYIKGWWYAGENNLFRYYFTSHTRLKMVEEREPGNEVSIEIADNEILVKQRVGDTRTFRKTGGP